ncbi:Serine/threonine-protein kinase pkn1 [Candidatus Electronema halotolerans]
MMFQDVPAPFPPPWASSWGEDALGLWLTLSQHGIRQLFRWIRPCNFLMGAPDEETAGLHLPGRETLHEVRLSKGFWLAETTVTQELWQAVMHSNPSGFSRPQQPVERVSWEDAQLFFQRLNAMLPKLQARLPFEAEWECACRAGSRTAFSFGEQIRPEQVNFNTSLDGWEELYRRRTVPVRSLPANAWGLYEMHGNVWEWCQDWWQENLGAAAAAKPQGPEQCDLRPVRGGSWVCDAASVRSASRDRYPADYRGASIGFRIAV